MIQVRRVFIVMFSLLLPLQSLRADCDPGNPNLDSDSDGVVDCSDGCPLDSFNTEAGDVCGCGFIDFDVNTDGTSECVETCLFDITKADLGLCSCPLFELITQAIGVEIFQCGRAPTADGKTVLTDPPGVVVIQQPDGLATVNIYFEEFSGAFAAKKLRPAARASNLRSTQLSSNLNPALAKAKKVKLKVRYEVIVTPEGVGTPRSKKILKRNTLTITNMSPGNYSAKYRVLGVNNVGTTLLRTKFSPKKLFSTIP